jgi:hypothetical protein
MTVVTGEIRVDEMRGDEARLLGAAPARANDFGSDCSQTLGAVAHVGAQTLRPDVDEIKTTISLEGPTCRC